MAKAPRSWATHTKISFKKEIGGITNSSMERVTFIKKKNRKFLEVNEN